VEEEKNENEVTEVSEQRITLIEKIFGPTLGAVILFLVEVVQIVLIAAVIIIPIRYWLVKPFIVKGASMEPNFYNDEYLIVDEISYDFREIVRGEVIVFIPPNNPSQFYIKRVVGLPGETISLRDGVMTIINEEHPEGVVLEESYISEYTSGRDSRVLADNEYYVVGDNRDASYDSRSFGPIKEDAITGRAWLRGYPIDRIGIIDSPEYTF